MELTTIAHNPPAFIEELTFWVKPELMDKYIQLDRDLWVTALMEKKGFLGSQVWLGEEGTGEITVLYFWEKYEDYTGLDQQWENDMKARTNEAMGEGAMRFIGAMEKSKRKFLAREYRL